MTDYQKLLNTITQLKAEMDQFRPLDQAQVKLLEQQIRLEHVWSSNAIEGSTISMNETASILNTGMTVHGMSLKEAMEAVDLAAAYDYMSELVSKQAPLSERIIRDLNRLAMIKNSDPHTAGAYRVVEAWPYGSEDQPYVSPFDIQPQMKALIEWAHTASEQLHPVEYAAELHERLVAIHPFADGNGRTARLVMNLALTEAGYPVINIQPDAKARQAYMDALGHARSTGDLLPFKVLIGKYTQETMEKRIDLLRRNEDNIAEAQSESDLF